MYNIQEVELRAVRIFMGVGRMHPLASLQFEMNMLPVKREGMKGSFEYWIGGYRVARIGHAGIEWTVNE